jgi:hypothetical protein
MRKVVCSFTVCPQQNTTHQKQIKMFYNKDYYAASLLLFETGVCCGFIGNFSCSGNGVLFNRKVIHPVVL